MADEDTQNQEQEQEPQEQEEQEPHESGSAKEQAHDQAAEGGSSMLGTAAKGAAAGAAVGAAAGAAQHVISSRRGEGEPAESEGSGDEEAAPDQDAES